MKNKIHEIKSFSSQVLSQKLLRQIISHQEINDLINEFNNKHYYSFYDSLRFQLGRSMVKHCSPINLINWETGIREKEIINDNPNNSTTIKTLDIINDFLNSESLNAMERINIYNNLANTGKTYHNPGSYDFSIVCSKDQLESYSSLLFSEENHEKIISYYLDYISLFPVTLYEFEKVFFYFLTFLTKEVYPANVQINEAFWFIRNINDIVKMRYIDINDRLILAIIHILSKDAELQSSCQSLYADIESNNDLTRAQFENMAS